MNHSTPGLPVHHQLLESTRTHVHPIGDAIQPSHLLSLLFNMLSRLVITFLPRSKHLLISWLQSPSAVILEPPKIKSATVSPFICHEVMGQRNQESNCQHPLDHRKTKRTPEKHLLLLHCTKAFDCVDHNKLWKILQKMGIPDHLTCLLRNLYASQGATVITRPGTMDWFQLGKGICQGCILSH